MNTVVTIKLPVGIVPSPLRPHANPIGRATWNTKDGLPRRVVDVWRHSNTVTIRMLVEKLDVPDPADEPRQCTFESAVGGAGSQHPYLCTPHLFDGNRDPNPVDVYTDCIGEIAIPIL